MSFPLYYVICLISLFRKVKFQRLGKKLTWFLFTKVVSSQRMMLVVNRPVSLTSVLCKVIEKLISIRIMKYVDEQGILSDNQFGFRSGRNCEQMLVKFFHLLCKTLDDRKCNLVDGIFLDFSSAFDKVDHNLLLTKLHSMGIRGFLLQWIQDFLSQRKQRVVFKGAVSDWCSVTSGVPQGSVLGPIFFVLFVNDINDVVSSPLFQFADDHTVLRPILTM